MSKVIRLGLFGSNGHQLSAALSAGVRARVAAVADYPAVRLDEALDAGSAARREVSEYGSLSELLADPDIDLVSLCSARRSEQAAHAIACLEAGKHVLAEKPGACTDEELDRILATAARTGREFHEMADSMLEAPVLAIRRLVERGELGTILHVQAHKSYPWHDNRPQDLDTDGGLTRWVGIHATRFIIAAVGLKITSVSAAVTGLGNPGAGAIHTAGVYAMTLENGAVACMNLNYFNPSNFGSWGNEQLRVYGDRGMAESVDGFRRHRLCIPGRESDELPLPDPPVSTCFIEHYANHLLDGTPFPFSTEEATAALRAAIAAHEAACTGRTVAVRL